METINIVFSSDNNYAQFMGVALCSIFENKKEGYLIDVYVLDGGVSDENKYKLKIIEDKYHFKINYIKIETEFFKDFYVSQYITQSSYYRIIITTLLPNLKKILYLDCDIVVINDIYNLYNIDIDNYYIAAVDDNILLNTRNNELNIPINNKYFNAGVILINIKKWKDSNITNEIISFIKKNPTKLKFWDQDALNAILWDKFLDIPNKYNYITELININKSNYLDIIENNVILHYAGGKPLDYLNRNPLNKKYFYYLSKTPWKNNKYTNKSIKNIIIVNLTSLIYFILPISIIKIIKRFLKIKFC